jgi:hypothetical protein
MMANPSRPSRLDGPATYQIVVQGRLDDSWAQWFEGIERIVTQVTDGAAVTTLTGTLPDQVALHGLLARIRDLCLPLLQVRCLEKPANPARTRPGHD